MSISTYKKTSNPIEALVNFGLDAIEQAVYRSVSKHIKSKRRK
jgi:hypothetical protein